MGASNLLGEVREGLPKEVTAELDRMEAWVKGWGSEYTGLSWP